jgi:outer membrane protein
MKMPTRLALLVLCCCLPLAATQAASLTDVYQRALRSDPQLREAEANRLASLEAKPQALAALLPRLNATGSYTKDKSSTTQFFPTDTNAFVPVGVDSDTRTKQWDLELRQNLFSWENWATLQRADSEVAQAEAVFSAEKQGLILRTAEKYFAVLAAKDQLSAAEGAKESIGRQLEQADKRFEVGLIAITDVQESRAGYDQSAAAVILAKRTLATRLEQLRELTGESYESLMKPGDDLALKGPDPANEEDWVKLALEQNLSIIASRLGSEIARDNISIARGGHAPTVDLVASKNGSNVNGDLNTSVSPVKSRADQDSNDKSISVQVNFPIYSGGFTQSRVREASYLHRAARERLERTVRETERATRDAYLGVLSEMARVQALKQSVQSAKTALQATEAGFEVGTRTTVDVLNSRRVLLDAETNLAQSKYDYLLNVLRLKSAAGTLDEPTLGGINASLIVDEPVK